MLNIKKTLERALRYHKAGNLPLAEKYYKKVLKVQPKNADALYLIGVIAHQCGKNKIAIDYIKQATTLNPHNESAYYHLGNALRDEGKLEEAVVYYKKAISIDPNNISVIDALGHTLQWLGNIEEAIACHKKTILIDPSYANGYFYLVQLRSSINASEIIVIKKLLEKKDLSEIDRELLHYSLAYIYDQSGNYEKAFPHIQEANVLRKMSLPESNMNDYSFLTDTIALFDKEYFEKRNVSIKKKSYGISSEVPIFIIGMPRSGTTLIEQIISSHPNAFGAGELKKIPQLVEQIFKNSPSLPKGKALSTIDDEQLNSYAEEYFEYLQSFAPNKSKIIDKMPGNFLYLGLIVLMFPNAKIIHCKRNPLDTCLSCFFKRFVEVYYSYDMEDLGKYYRAYEQFMAHWHNVLPIDILDVQYEELIEKQEEMSRKIISFVGLDWDDRCLQFYENKRSVNTASSLQVRKPIYRNSIERWRNYESFLAPLKESLGIN